MKRTCLLVMLACALSGAAAVRAATDPPASGAPQSLTLGNGVRVLLAPDPRAAAVDVAVWVEAGVRYERPGIVGISHLFEHLTSMGVAPGGDDELRRRIAALGGHSAAYTAADFTCYTHTVPRAALESVVRLEA